MSTISNKALLKSSTLSNLYDKLTETKQKLEDSKLNFVHSFEEHKISEIHFLKDLGQLNDDVQKFKRDFSQKKIDSAKSSSSVNPRVQSPFLRRGSNKTVFQDESNNFFLISAVLRTNICNFFKFFFFLNVCLFL
jgi:hypothetical protein